MLDDKIPLLTDTTGLVGFLDDHPEKTEKYADAGIAAYVRDWPYNRSVRYATRVWSVGEYLYKIGAYAK